MANQHLQMLAPIGQVVHLHKVEVRHAPFAPRVPDLLAAVSTGRCPTLSAANTGGYPSFGRTWARNRSPRDHGPPCPGNRRFAIALGTPKSGSHVTHRWRETDSNHRSREGGHRRLGRLICCSRELPRCGLFCLSGAELLRRDSGRIGGLERGEFERDSARKEIAA